jgi:hypothetical protein
LPREKLARITFRDLSLQTGPGSGVSSNSSMPSDTDIAALAQKLLSGSKSTNQTNNIAEQLLKDAGPEATQMYNQMLQGLLSGSLSVDEIRKQAKKAVTDADQMKDELGPEAGELLEGYLSILRQFIEQSEPKPESE